MRRASLLLAGVMLLASCGDAGNGRLIVAAGTTLVDSGILDELMDRYERANPGTRVSVVGESTTRVLELGRRGAADLLITHAPLAEDAFVADGLAVGREPVFASSFVLVGPADLAGELAGLDPAAAFDEIAARGWEFVSRADGSGTHEREMAVWDLAAADAAGPWYTETGQGMGVTLQVASQRRAFTLAEEGTFRRAAAVLDLATVDTGESGLLVNVYSAIVVGGPDQAGSADVLTWVKGPSGVSQLVAANIDLFGEVVYRPDPEALTMQFEEGT